MTRMDEGSGRIGVEGWGREDWGGGGGGSEEKRDEQGKEAGKDRKRGQGDVLLSAVNECDSVRGVGG